MKVCIVGAGAIGGFIGTRLALAGRAQVSAIARGATLAALREHGWRLQQGAELVRSSARAVERASELGVQDLVVIAVKSPALPAVALAIGPLLGPDTIVLPAMNGVPWWFGDGVAALGSEPLRSVDALGTIAAAIPIHHVVGCVVHAGCAAAFGLEQHGVEPVNDEICGIASLEPQVAAHRGTRLRYRRDLCHQRDRGQFEEPLGPRRPDLESEIPGVIEGPESLRGRDQAARLPVHPASPPLVRPGARGAPGHRSCRDLRLTTPRAATIT